MSGRQQKRWCRKDQKEQRKWQQRCSREQTPLCQTVMAGWQQKRWQMSNAGAEAAATAAGGAAEDGEQEGGQMIQPLLRGKAGATEGA